MGAGSQNTPTSSTGCYPWEFEKGERSLSIDVPGPFTINNTQLAIGLAVGGAALAYLPEPAVTEQVGAGRLTTVLDDWAPMGPGFHVYYTSRRQVPTALRLLIEHVREMRPLGL